MQPPEVRTATFMMSDIAGSTRLWEEHRDAMGAALAIHDALLAGAIAGAGGTLVKTTGDGVLAVFDRPGEAVRAAIDGQRRLRDQPWGATGPIRVRMAIHSGTAETRDGDYHGTPLNRVARLLAIGHGGQVLVSGAAAALAGDDLPADARLVDRGEHHLRDLSKPEHVLQLVVPDLPADFPPLRSERPRAGLPAPLTSFIGRERELAEVRRLIEAHRLVSLVGVGGTGKTRLMLQAAEGIAGRYRHGIGLVELAAVTNPVLVTQEVVRALAIPELPSHPADQTVTDYLRPRELLLLLDNCEHLVEACAELVVQLLSACQDLRVLVTSREALGVPGEVILPVPSLGVPTAGHDGLLTGTHLPPSPAEIEASEAVQLFLDRARSTLPGFQPGPDDLAGIAGICRRLDGIPLAIELAAARVNVLNVAQIAQRLGDRFRLLTGGRRTAVPRQQTLQTLIDWSWDLLTPDDQRRLRRLSVFAGGWSLEDAVAVTADGPDAPGIQDDTIDGLARLVDRSLVVVDRSREPRFRMLETIRQYAEERLAASGEAPTVRDRHLARFAAGATAAAGRMEGPELPALLRWFDAELENLRAAMDWGFETDPETAIRVALAMARVWRHRPAWVEGPDRIRQTVATLEALPEPPPDARPARLALEADVLAAAGQSAAVTGRAAETARDWTERAIERARASGDQRSLCGALVARALALTFSGAPIEQIEPVFAEMVPLAEALGEWSKLAYALAGYAMFRAVVDPASATPLIEQGTLAARRSGDPSAIVFAAVSRGRAFGRAGDMARARAAFADAQAAADELGSSPMALVARSDLAHALRSAGELDEAEQTLRETIGEWQALGQRGAIASQLEAFGYIALERGDGVRAATLLGAADALRIEAAAPQLPHERLEHDRRIDALHDLPDQASLLAAWDTGRTLSIPEAVDLVRRG